jgi:ArsR family transcriptional regulator
MTSDDPLDGLDDRFLTEDNLNDLQFYLDLIKTMAEPTRFAILVELLDANDGRSPKELADSLGLDGLHQHLNKLVDAGLVNNWKESNPDQHGVYSHYEISGYGLAALDVFEELLEEERAAAEYSRDGGNNDSNGGS